MTATHLPGRHRLSRRSAHTGPRVGMVSMIAAAGTAGWLFAMLDDEPQTLSLSAPQPSSAVAARDIQRSGHVTAVSPDSLTTTTADGQVTTFRITPDTTQITRPGTAAPYAANSFSPAQSVVVIGVVRDGVPVATAIADRAAVGPGGPPMDYGLPT